MVAFAQRGHRVLRARCQTQDSYDLVPARRAKSDSRSAAGATERLSANAHQLAAVRARGSAATKLAGWTRTPRIAHPTAATTALLHVGKAASPAIVVAVYRARGSAVERVPAPAAVRPATPPSCADRVQVNGGLVIVIIIIKPSFDWQKK